MNIDWSKAPEWAVGQGEVDEEGLSVWVGGDCYSYVVNPGSVFVWASSKANLAFRHRSELRNLIERPAQWNGEGLPPGGTVCEMRRTDYVDVDWQRIEFLCAGSKKAFFRDREGHEWSRPLGDLKFRPIRTPEQIAEEEREAAHQELMHHIAGYMGRDNPHSADDGLAQYLLDHDYRKQSLP